jgi:sulfite reductase (NADPH) flavoprotein alpha-component
MRGFLLLPLIITISLSGIAYLFKEPVEDVIYKDLYFGNSAQTIQLPMSQAVLKTERDFPGYCGYSLCECNSKFT